MVFCFIYILSKLSIIGDIPWRTSMLDPKIALNKNPPTKYVKKATIKNLLILSTQYMLQEIYV